MAEALNYILNIVWAWELKCKTVYLCAKSQRARLCKLSNVLTGDLNLTTSSVWGTLHCSWCARLRCDKLHVLCVLFSKQCCATKLCLLYYHAKEVFNHPDTFHYVCAVDLPSNLRSKILTHSLRNVVSFTLGVKWLAKIKVGPLIFVV